MLSGLDVFDSVDERLAQATREARAAQAEAEALTGRRDAARAAEAAALRDLARLRLRALAEGDASLGQLDTAEAGLRDLLAQRAAAVEAAGRTVAARQQALATARAERNQRAAELRAAEAEEAQALEAARARLDHDPAWRARREAAVEAARIAAHAAGKASLAREDLEEKGRPYRQDPLFAYLWDRGFGTSRYRAGSVPKLLDSWTARVAAYEPARRNYALLSELPGRLAEHAARMQDQAEAAAAALAAEERRVAGTEGAGPARDALDQAEAALDDAAAALAEAERARAALADGEDEAMRDATARLEAALGAASLRNLREAARRTPSPEDDAIVARLERAAADRTRAEAQLGTARAAAEAARQRLAETQTLRQEMRSRGYGQDRWDFKDGALVGVLINEMLRGALSRDGFWDRMGQHRLPQGSGVPGPWSAPPGGGGFGGGGFRTGGRMGGGGRFKTGGSF